MNNNDEILSSSSPKTEIKPSTRKNVIPITSISDVGTLVGEIHNQIAILIDKVDSDVSPEFKALMEGYVNKANETEEYKLNLANITSKYEELKSEISKARETNRSLVHELQNTREILNKLESDLNSAQAIFKKTEDEFKEKIKTIELQNLELEDIINQLEEEKLIIEQESEKKLSSLTEAQEKLRQELLDQNFKSHQNTQELIIQRDNLKKQVEEFEMLLKDQSEKLELKTKEAEYKDALLNQLIKQTTTDKLKPQVDPDPESNKEQAFKKKKSWFFNR